MRTEHDMDWPGAETEAGAHRTKVFLGPREAWLEDKLESNLPITGVKYYLEHNPWKLEIQGKFFEWEVSMLAAGVLPERDRTPVQVEVQDRYL